MKLTPSFAGFIKGILGVVVLCVVTYLADAAHLNGILNPTLSVMAAALFSAIESGLKASSGGTTALFGAARIK